MSQSGGKAKKLLDRKAALVRETLSGQAMAIAAYFEDRSGPGIFLMSQSDRPVRPWFEIRIPEELIVAASATDMETQDSRETRVAGYLVGVGNRSELLEIVDTYKKILREEAGVFGIYENIGEELDVQLAHTLNAEYRASDPAIPYRVEFLTVSFINQVLRVVRFKSDGDFHPVVNFGIAGGYHIVGEDTVRHLALQALRAAYSKGTPTYAQVKKIVTQAFALDDRRFTFGFDSKLSFG